MNRLSLYSFRTVRNIALGTALAAVAVLPTFAAGGGTSATVTGGSLTLSGAVPGNFTGANITGIDQTTTAALAAFTASDLRGSGAGWHVTAQATNFNGATHNLAASSLSMSHPTATANGTSSPIPTVVAGAYVIDSGSAVQIASAALNEGMGAYDFSATTLTLSLPAAVYADTYASTVTISAVTAP